MILGEIDPSAAPKGMIMVLECLFWGGGFALMMVALVKLVRGKPSAPPNEQLEQAHQHLRKEFDKELAQNLIDHQNLFSKLGGVERGVEARLMTRLTEISKDDKTSRASMHHELTEVGKDVAALQKETELQNQRLFQMDGKLDRLIERKNS